MKIKKDELITALENARGFTGSSFPIFKKVMVDGPAGVIVATNFETTAIIGVGITDFLRDIAGEKPFNPEAGEEFLAELSELKKAQLEPLAEYAGIIPVPSTKAEIVGAIMTASQNSHAAMEAIPAPMTKIEERFCVDPVQLLKIVKTLEAKGDDYVDLIVSEFEYRENILESVQATSLTVGNHFQRLLVSPVSEFPAYQDPKEIGRPFTSVRGATLNNVVKIGLDTMTGQDGHPYKTKVLFDTKAGFIVACDGARVHVTANKMAEMDATILLPAKAMKNACKVAGTEEMKVFINADASVLRFQVGKMAILTKNDPDMKYPDYLEIINKEQAHEVLVDRKLMMKVITQANLMDKGSACLTFNGGINIESQSETGIYNRENIPFISGSVQPSIKVSLNTKFMHDAIACIAENVKIMLNAADSIVYFSNSKDFKACIMPLRV